MSNRTLQELKNALLEYDSQKVANLASKTITEKIDPLKTLNMLTDAIREVGDSYGRGELWLPDLVGAADAMQHALPIIEREIKRTGGKRVSQGIVVIGTVFGDIHSIGKDMVSTLLTAGGFEVHDLGVNIKAQQFIDAIREFKADILAMSALLTSTAVEQKKVIEILNTENLRDTVKIMIGGGAITADFCRNIGADGYEPTAPGAVKLARSLLGK